MNLVINTGLVIFTLTIVGFGTNALFAIAKASRKVGEAVANHVNIINELTNRINSLEKENIELRRELKQVRYYLAKNTAFELRAE